MKDKQSLHAGDAAGAPLPNPAKSPHRILVIDDDLGTRQLSLAVLAGAGYEVEGVKDGAAGWKALQAKNYDLIVTNNKMPKMTGLELIEKLRGADRVIPVLMATASSKEIRDLKSALDEHAIVAVTDPRGIITYVNDKFCAISKYPREELLGQDHRIINSGHHSKDYIRILWTTITHGRVWKGEFKNKAKDGSYYWVDTTIVPFLDERGKPRQYVAIRTDITAHKAQEEQNRQLNTELEQRVAERTAQLQAANQELEAFSYSVSHDLRAPLRHVMAFVQMLRQEAGPSLSEECLRYLATISQSAKQMGDLIKHLLEFSRLGQTEVQKQEVPLGRLVKEVLGDFQAGTRGRNIIWEIHPVPAVRADRALLRQVLVNLISNAVKFTGTRAEPKIECGCAPSGDDETVIFIRDNGVGFDPQYAGKLFGVFQRLHRREDFEGTGIGLANVRRIIHRHGGRTWAEGVVDGGASFYFSIPRGRQEVGK
jgi:PAS domain S-box-containing protein